MGDDNHNHDQRTFKEVVQYVSQVRESQRLPSEVGGAPWLQWVGVAARVEDLHVIELVRRVLQRVVFAFLDFPAYHNG